MRFALNLVIVGLLLLSFDYNCLARVAYNTDDSVLINRNQSSEFAFEGLSTYEKTIHAASNHPNNPDNKTFAFDPKSGDWTLVKSKEPESSEILLWNQNNDHLLTL